MASSLRAPGDQVAGRGRHRLDGMKSPNWEYDPPSAIRGVSHYPIGDWVYYNQGTLAIAYAPALLAFCQLPKSGHA